MRASQRAAGTLDRRRRLLVLCICSFSLFMTYLDTTVLNVALPTMERDLHAGLSDLQWVVDAYMLVLASLLLLSGSAGDRLGRRRIFTIGLLTFSAGSLLCSLAPNVDVLIAFRALQAVGGSMLTPVSLSIVRTTFTDPGERARALGVWSAVFGLAAACGPIVGGVLVDFVGWRSVFWVNVPVGLLAFLLARSFIPESRAPRARRVDPAGQLLVILVLASLTYGVIQGPSEGWGAPAIVGAFALALVALVVFLAVEPTRPEPLLDVRFFRSRPFSGACAIAVLSFTVLAGFLFVNTLYLQEVRHDSALVAGLSVLPATLAIVAVSPLSGRLVARGGPRVPLATAGALIVAGAAMLLLVRPATPFLELAAAYVLLGLGLGLVNPPITNTAVSSMPPEQAGVASAVASAARQLGNVLGIAVMGALLVSRFAAELPSKLAALRLPPAARAALAHATISAAGTSLPGGASHHLAIRTAVDRAFASATHLPWLLAVGCGVGVGVVALATTGRRAFAHAAGVYVDAPAESPGYVGAPVAGPRRDLVAPPRDLAAGPPRDPA